MTLFQLNGLFGVELDEKVIMNSEYVKIRKMASGLLHEVPSRDLEDRKLFVRIACGEVEI
jgi:hypothetical protein